MSDNFEQLIKKAREFHGHICPPVLAGLRIGLKVKEIFKDVLNDDRDILAIFETDACHADGVQIASGITFGRGAIRLKMMGKMGITFFNPETRRGCRFLLLVEHFNEIREKLQAKVSDSELAEWFMSLPDEKIWSVKKVLVNDKEVRAPVVHDSVICANCGEFVKETETISIGELPTMGLKSKSGKVCKYCAGKKYYEEIN
jgi:formylmethanofuran dehydrogenase subunit E